MYCNLNRPDAMMMRTHTDINIFFKKNNQVAHEIEHFFYTQGYLLVNLI